MFYAIHICVPCSIDYAAKERRNISGSVHKSERHSNSSSCAGPIEILVFYNMFLWVNINFEKTFGNTSIENKVPNLCTYSFCSGFDLLL